MVAASSIEGGLKMTSEGMSSAAGGQFGNGTLGGTGMVSNFVLNSTEIKPPYCLLVQKSSLSEAVAKQFRTAYDDYREKIAVQTAQDGILRRVARVEELMALSHRRTIAMMFYRNARDLSELQLWEGLERIAKVQRDADIDADQLQRDLQPLLRWSAERSLSNNLTHVTGGLVGYLEESNLTSTLMNEDGSWLKGPGKIIARLWIVGLTPPRFQRAVRCRCELLSAEGDPMRVMEVTQQMVEKFEKAEQLLGVSIPVGNGNGDGGKVAVGASVKSAGSSLKKTSSFMGRCDRSDKSWYISTTRTKRNDQRQEQKVQNRWLRQAAIVWSGRYKNYGVLCSARTKRDGRRLQQEVQNRRLRQATVVWSCRYKKCQVLCSARIGRDGRRPQQEVQNQRLWQAIVVWSGRYENCRVLFTERTGRDGQCQQQKVQNRWLRKEAVVWSGRYENRGVLHTARTKRDGRRQKQKV